MKRVMHDPALADLPAPISLTPDQLAQVASDTGAMLGAGGGCVPIIIAGGISPGPIYVTHATTTLAV
jgi:hypothetical protein